MNLHLSYIHKLLVTHEYFGLEIGVPIFGFRNNKRQFTFPIPGQDNAKCKLNMKNSAVIEHTILAVDLLEQNNCSSTGEIVIAESSTFRNNAKAVRALNYTNFDSISSIGLTVFDNKSYFNNYLNCKIILET